MLLKCSLGGKISLHTKAFQQNHRKALFIRFLWKLIGDFHNFCISDEIEKIYTQLKKLIHIS